MINIKANLHQPNFMIRKAIELSFWAKLNRHLGIFIASY